MKYSSKIFEQLEQQAIESNSGWARLSAAIVYKNRVISTGVNSLKSHPFQKKYGRNVESIYLHAEISAIKSALRCLDVDDLSDVDLYVCRMKRDGQNTDFQHGLAKPCDGCQRAIADFGIRNVYYTTNNPNEIEYL